MCAGPKNMINRYRHHQ